jgi:prevent-host-death family protein
VKTVSLREANRDFSKLIQEIERRGEVYVITRHGRPVARLGPENGDKRSDPEWARAFEEMKRLHAEGLDLGGLRVKRDEIYDRI